MPHALDLVALDVKRPIVINMSSERTHSPFLRGGSISAGGPVSDVKRTYLEAAHAANA
jgi:hypothetical protein